MATLSLLKRTSVRSRMRVGRGGRRGKTAGRGTKGQNARAGRKKRPELRDIIKKLPKRRGFGKNRARTVDATKVRPVSVSLARLEKTTLSEITPRTLAEAGVVRMISGKVPPVKIVGSGSFSRKVAVKGCSTTAGAKSALEKAGGTIA